MIVSPDCNVSVHNTGWAPPTVAELCFKGFFPQKLVNLTKNYSHLQQHTAYGVPFQNISKSTAGTGVIAPKRGDKAGFVGGFTPTGEFHSGLVKKINGCVLLGTKCSDWRALQTMGRPGMGQQVGEVWPPHIAPLGPFVGRDFEAMQRAHTHLTHNSDEISSLICGHEWHTPASLRNIQFSH